MKNKNAPWIVLGLAAVIYLALSFAIPFSRTACYWIAFVFGLVALAAQMVFFRRAFDGAQTVLSKLYGFPIMRVGLIYLVVQLAASFLLMALAAFAPEWVAVLIGTVLLALAGIGLVGAAVARDEVERQETALPDLTVTMKQVRAQTDALAAGAPDELRPAAQKLAEAVRYSDPVTSPAMRETDDALLASAAQLRAAPTQSGMDAFALRLSERNAMCKASK